MNTKDYISLEEKYGAHNYHPLDIVIDKAQGIWVYDVDGKKYLDFLAAYSAVNQGHCHPKLIKVVKDQVDKVTLTSRAFRNSKLPLFYEKICKLSGFPMALPMNSGAEAVETAVKAARKWGYTKKGIEENKAEIIVCENNFHGRTTTVVSFSTEQAYKEGFGPFTPGFKVIPFNDLAALEKAINKNTCAFLVEPIQGEAGINIPDKGYLKKVREICTKNKVLLMLDEIQAGLGRTGKMFAFEHEEMRPDVLILGKAISGGFYPVSVALSEPEVLGVFKPGEHGSTFGGNPLGTAIAIEALNILEDENLVKNARELGSYFIEKIKTVKSKNIKEVRGLGLFIGVELFGPARPYCEALMHEGLLCKETHENVIRFAPPLVIKKDEIDWAFERIKRVIEK